MEGVHKRALREGIRRQGVHQEGALREPFRQGHPSRAWPESQHEEQAHANVGQDHAPQEVRHRVHQRPAQEQGKPCTFKTPLCAQLPRQPLLRAHGILFLRQQARSLACACRENRTTGAFLNITYPELAYL